jgi:ferric enterobactin receptor
MPNRLRTLLAALLLLGAAAPLAAQNPQGPPPGMRPGMAPGAQQPGGVVSGRVVDAEGAPLRTAQVAVWSAADSALVTGTVVRPDGSFRVEGLRPGRYFLRVSALGYATAATGVLAVTPQAPEADAGVVRMAAGALLLEGLTVEAEAAPARLEPDRNSYSVREMPATAGGNATDVLRNVPAVEVDPDGRVSLRGNQNVAVQINGRPAPMRGEQLGNFLAQLPAAMLERVEVVPNPSARYEPEGMAGIINIVLRENTDLGLSYGTMAGVGTGGRYNASGNVGYQAGPLTLYGSYGFRRDERRNRGTNLLQRYGQEGGEPVFFLDQAAAGSVDILSHLFNGSADYRLGRRDVLSSTLMLSRGSFDNATGNLYEERDGGRDLIRRYEGDNRSDADNSTVDASLAFRRTFRPRAHELSAELRANRGVNETRSLFEERFLVGSDGREPRSERLAMDSETRVLTAQGDYTRTLDGGTRVETGYKGTLRALDNGLEAEIFDPATGSWTPNALRSNRFDYDETVHAGYLVLGRELGPVQAQGGVRVERTDREFRLADTGERFPKGYWSVFPSAAASLPLDERRLVRLSYSRRINRPDARLLNPLSFSEDQLNRMVGNPELGPEYTHAAELTYQHSFLAGSVQATPFFRRTEDAIRRIREMRGDTAILTFRNLEVSDSYGADLNGSLRLGRVSGFASFSAFRTVTEAGSEDSALSASGFGWSTRASGTVRLNDRLDLQGFVMYRAPMAVEQGRMGSMTMSNVSLRQKVLGERGTLTLRLMDPLDRMGFSMRTEAPLYTQFNERRFGGRALFVNFSYAVGQQPRVRQRPQQQEEPADPTTIPGIAP